MSIVATNPVHERLQSIGQDEIDSTPAIAQWVDQFEVQDRPMARSMIRRLRFVPADLFSSWVQDMIGNAADGQICAVYAIRKLNGMSFWSADGTVAPRPGDSLGSEDLMYSCIRNACLRQSERLLDHPSVQTMRERRVDRILFVDDSMGTGDQAAGFAREFMAHPTLRSWSSLGVIGLSFVSFSRLRHSERNIQSLLPMVYRRPGAISREVSESRLSFRSRHVLDSDRLISRWGPEFKAMLSLCDRYTKNNRFRRGYGGTMANIVFSHSVPNNIPGLFFCTEKHWKPLFPRRTVPLWLRTSLSSHSRPSAPDEQLITPELLILLYWVGRGILNISSIAFRIDRDLEWTVGLHERAVRLGLVSSNQRLTEAGRKAVRGYTTPQQAPQWNQSLYTPTSWCADR